MFRMTVTWENLDKSRPTIWEALAAKLGREPTHAEAVADVRRILEESMVDLAAKGRLPHQRKGRA